MQNVDIENRKAPSSPTPFPACKHTNNHSALKQSILDSTMILTDIDVYLSPTKKRPETPSHDTVSS